MFNIYPHFAVSGFSNSYFVCNSQTKEAFIVDPGHFDAKLLTTIENGAFSIVAILITHAHFAHTQGLKTLLKIYDATVYYGGEGLNGVPWTPVHDGQLLPLLGSRVKALHIGGHSRDSFVFQFEEALFTGDVLEAGRIGSCSTPFLRTHLINRLSETLLPLTGNSCIYPGHGPLTTLDIERELLTRLQACTLPGNELPCP